MRDTKHLAALLSQVAKDSAANDEAIDNVKALDYPPLTDQSARLKYDIAQALWKRANTILKISTKAYEAALADIANPDKPLP
jgi:hypothetical protein